MGLRPLYILYSFSEGTVFVRQNLTSVVAHRAKRDKRKTRNSFDEETKNITRHRQTEGTHIFVSYNFYVNSLASLNKFLRV